MVNGKLTIDLQNSGFTMWFSIFSKQCPLAARILVVAALALLGACNQKSVTLDSLGNPDPASSSPADFQETAKLGEKWRSDTKNIKKGMAFADGLEAIGQTDQQLDVLRQLAQENSGNTQLSSLYGKKLLAAGKSDQALPVLQQAAAMPGADWRVISALGSAYDQQGQYEQARIEYGKALVAQPNELGVLNNMGMSFALQGNLPEAEKVLRQVSSLPKADSRPRIRQNLALVVGLQGRFDEARQIASADLPPEQVAENMEFLKKMLAQPNTWQQLKEEKEG